jgi:hypothetical protein
MFEDNNINEFDLMVKSILDDAKEDVPAEIWNGVSEGLDKAARKRTVVLWWRRAAAGTAFAAALAALLVLGHEDGQLPDGKADEMIAVVEDQTVSNELFAEDIMHEELSFHEEKVEQAVVHRQVSEAAVSMLTAMAYTEEAVAEEVPEEHIPQDAHEAVQAAEKPQRVMEERRETEYFPEDWGEDEKKGRREVSLVFSGIAGTNNAQNDTRPGPMRAPSAAVPQKTGITETSSRSTYGIPLSAGIGVRIGLNDRWSIGTGAGYTYLSRTFYGKYTQVGEGGQITNTISSDIRNTQSYIGIPVNVFCNILGNEHLNFYAYAGGAAEKCISDKYEVLNTTFTHKEKVKGVQFSTNVGIGVEFMLGKHLGLYIDPSLRYYFDNGQPESIRTAQPLMLGFEMGFRARL